MIRVTPLSMMGVYALRLDPNSAGVAANFETAVIENGLTYVDEC
jgi:hypothetical protein